MSTGIASGPTADARHDGRGPGGMWWVAWRLHRRLLIGWIAGVGVAVVALVVRRQVYLAAEVHATCLDEVAPDGGRICLNPLLLAMYEHGSWWESLHAALVLAPAVAGLLGGVALFAPEFDRGTQVMVLSQSVTRMRWCAVTTVVVTVPLVAGAAALGTATAAARAAIGPWAAEWYDHYEFATSGWVAAGLCLLGVGVGAVAGLVLRSPLPAVLAGVVTMAAVMAVVSVYRPDFVAHDRAEAPISANLLDEIPELSWTIGGGLLDADGSEVDYPRCGAVDQIAWDTCLAQNHITGQWADSIPVDRRGELQARIAAVCAAVAALCLVVGAVILRRRRAL